MNQFLQLGYEPILDKHGNIYVKKPAFKGFEKLPIVCIQGHSDMVGAKEESSEHDFIKDPIIPIVENG
jgi:dipeptidase D